MTIAHIIIFNDEQEAIATQAASETGLSVHEYLNRVVIHHLERIEPTQDKNRK
jgi:hypothetical protein